METDTSSSMTSPAAASNTNDPQVIARRERSLIDGILNNESLTSDLNDEDAQEMIDWSVAMAKEAAQVTAGLEEPQAEKIISERMYANRKLMRSIKRLVVEGKDLDHDGHTELLSQIREQARLIYGDDALRHKAAQELLGGEQTVAANAERRVAHFRRALDPRIENN
jgi:hypothetical protein